MCTKATGYQSNKKLNLAEAEEIHRVERKANSKRPTLIKGRVFRRVRKLTIVWTRPAVLALSYYAAAAAHCILVKNQYSLMASLAIIKH